MDSFQEVVDALSEEQKQFFHVMMDVVNKTEHTYVWPSIVEDAGDIILEKAHFFYVACKNYGHALEEGRDNYNTTVQVARNDVITEVEDMVSFLFRFWKGLSVY